MKLDGLESFTPESVDFVQSQQNQKLNNYFTKKIFNFSVIWIYW